MTKKEEGPGDPACVSKSPGAGMGLACKHLRVSGRGLDFFSVAPELQAGQEGPRRQVWVATSK